MVELIHQTNTAGNIRQPRQSERDPTNQLSKEIDSFLVGIFQSSLLTEFEFSIELKKFGKSRLHF